MQHYLRVLYSAGRVLHRLSLRPGSGLELTALAEKESAQPHKELRPGGRVASIVDSLERLALDVGEDHSKGSAGVSLSPALDFEEFLQRQDKFVKVSMC